MSNSPQALEQFLRAQKIFWALPSNRIYGAPDKLYSPPDSGRLITWPLGHLHPQDQRLAEALRKPHGLTEFQVCIARIVEILDGVLAEDPYFLPAIMLRATFVELEANGGREIWSQGRELISVTRKGDRFRKQMQATRYVEVSERWSQSRIIRKDSGSAAFRFAGFLRELGFRYLRSDEYDDAIQTIQESVEWLQQGSPRSRWYLFNFLWPLASARWAKAKDLAREGHFNEAITEAHKTIEVHTRLGSDSEQIEPIRRQISKWEGWQKVGRRSPLTVSSRPARQPQDKTEDVRVLVRTTLEALRSELEQLAPAQRWPQLKDKLHSLMEAHSDAPVDALTPLLSALADVYETEGRFAEAIDLRKTYHSSGMGIDILFGKFWGRIKLTPKELVELARWHPDYKSSKLNDLYEEEIYHGCHKALLEVEEKLGTDLLSFYLGSARTDYRVDSSAFGVQLKRTNDHSLVRSLIAAAFEIVTSVQRRVRVELGIPSSRWISESALYQHIRDALPDHEVQYNARPSWLLGQSLDIYIPELGLAIEYQGLQHYEPVEFFGGEEAFYDRKKLDALKSYRCQENNIKLAYWHYEQPVNKKNVRLFLKEHSISAR